VSSVLFRWIAAACLSISPIIANAATVVVDSYYTAFDTYEIVIQADAEASSTGKISINAPNDVSAMGWDLSAFSGSIILGGPLSSGFLLGGESDTQSFTNSGTTAGIVQAIFAFAATEWDALGATVQAALLDPEGSPDIALTRFTADAGSGTGGGTSGGGSNGGVGGEVPLPASAPFLLAGILGLAGLRRRKRAA